MNLSRSLAALVAVLAASGASAAGSDFRIDTTHAQVFFSASHDGYTNPVGRMKVKSGFFRFDPDDWSQSKVDVTLDVVTLDMGDKPWNDKLLSAYFDVSNHPTARYVSTGIEKTGERTGVVHGTLTLLGKTLPVDLKVTLNKAAVNGYTLHYVAGFTATAQFRRSAFGMSRSLKDVGDDVSVHIEIEGVRDGDAAKNAAPAENSQQ